MAVVEETFGAKIGVFFFCKDKKPFGTCIKVMKYQLRGKGITFIYHY